jgi:ArsR family transcriptional regulator, arsenate/arsenite/antimonite-responsive transcriptional repressor
MERLHQIFKALADPNRLRILNLLLEDRCCVCELESALDLPQSLVSRHLAYLRAAGLVRDRRQGMRVQYGVALDSETGQALQAFLRRAFNSDQAFRRDRDQLRAAFLSAAGAGDAPWAPSAKG